MNEDHMRLRSAPLLLALALTASAQAPDKAAVQARVAELKQSVAANRGKLANYQWTEITTILLKGEVKKTETSLCKFGPDGTIQKQPLGPSPEQNEKPRGLKGKIVAKKVDELKDYGTRLKSLISHYTPPNRDKIQTAFQAGNVSIAPGDGVTSMTISNYYKSGDKVTYAFDTTAKKIRNLSVDTYLDDPQKDIVKLVVNFASLDDGTNYAADTDLKAASKNMEIKTQNTNYEKIAH
jgi:hypothetical protein